MEGYVIETAVVVVVVVVVVMTGIGIGVIASTVGVGFETSKISSGSSSPNRPLGKPTSSSKTAPPFLKREHVVR